MTDKASAVSYGVNSGVALFGALTLNEILAIVGVVLAIATFGVNWFYQRRRDKREAAYHELQMRLTAAAEKAG